MTANIPAGANEPEWERRIRMAVNAALDDGVKPETLTPTLGYLRSSLEGIERRERARP